MVCNRTMTNLGVVFLYNRTMTKLRRGVQHDSGKLRRGVLVQQDNGKLRRGMQQDNDKLRRGVLV